MAHIQLENEQITYNARTIKNNLLAANNRVHIDTPSLPIQQQLLLESEDECCICFENQNNNSVNGGEMHTLVCGHQFHLHCLKRWFDEKHKCPLCMKKMSRLPIDQSLTIENDDGTKKSSDTFDHNCLNEQGSNTAQVRSTIRSLLPWTILCGIVVVIIIVIN